MSIGFAVLGCGRIGRMHAANVARHPGARLVAVYDVVADAAAGVAAAHGARQAASVDDALADPAVDAVLIATSTDTHIELMMAAARAGKAVLCEKPVDLDIGRAERCWAEIGPLNPRIMIGFQRRFDPSIAAVARRAQAGEIGQTLQLIITSRDPSPPPIGYIAVSGGLFRDMTIHDFDLARFLAGEIVEVTAIGGCLISPEIGAASDIDSAMLILRSESGMLVHINNSRACAYGYDQRLELFGSAGALRVGNQYPTSVESWSAGGTGTTDAVQPFFIERYDAAYQAELSHFIDCVRDGRAPEPDFTDGLAALRIADAALESLRCGGSVRLV